MTTTLSLNGSGFYPNSSANLNITTDKGAVTGYLMTTDASGNVAYSLAIASIIGIGSASSVSLYATDSTMGTKSNTISIPVTYQAAWMSYNLTPSVANGGRFTTYSGGLPSYSPNMQVSVTATESGVSSPPAMVVYASQDQKSWYPVPGVTFSSSVTGSGGNAPFNVSVSMYIDNAIDAIQNFAWGNAAHNPPEYIATIYTVVVDTANQQQWGIASLYINYLNP